MTEHINMKHKTCSHPSSLMLCHAPIPFYPDTQGYKLLWFGTKLPWLGEGKDW